VDPAVPCRPEFMPACVANMLVWWFRIAAREANVRMPNRLIVSYYRL
jgi:hypothetical protein